MEEVGCLDSGHVLSFDTAAVLTMSHIRQIDSIGETISVDVTKSLVLVSTVTCVVVEVAVEKGLLGEISSLSVGDGIGGFDSAIQ